MFYIKRSFSNFNGFTLKAIRSDTEFKFEISSEYTDKYGETFKYSFIDQIYKLEDIKKRPDFCDYVLYGFYVNRTDLRNLEEMNRFLSQARQFGWTVPVLKTKLTETYGYDISSTITNSSRLINITALTLPTKNSFEGLPNILSGTRFFQIFFPYAACDLSSAVISIVTFNGMEVESADELIQLETDKLTSDVVALEHINKTTGLPTLQLTGKDIVVANELTNLTIKLINTSTNKLITDNDVEVYVELINGYSPYSRITTKSGIATLPVRAMDMVAGDTIKVKVGFKYFPGIASKTITVK